MWGEPPYGALSPALKLRNVGVAAILLPKHDVAAKIELRAGLVAKPGRA
jgi:hypothetical protein